MKKYINTLLRSFMLLQITLLCSCHMLHEDMSECDQFLKFRYDYNLSYEDWFGQQVEEVKVFIFDKEGKYRQTLSETTPALAAAGYKMKIPYEMKGYTAVVWAGKTDQDYRLPQLAVGDPIDKLSLRYEPQNNISTHQMAALWHSGAHTMTFTEAKGTEQTVSLVRNTNDLHITVRPNSREAETMSNYDITITGANGSYDYKNDFLEGISEIAYRPSDKIAQQTADIYTLRLVKGAQLRISVKEKASGESILIAGEAETDLIELLLKGKPEGMADQEYLDRRYIWEISLNYNTGTYIAISITINGWTHWFHNTDL